MTITLRIIRDGVAQDIDLRGSAVRVERDDTVTRPPETPQASLEARLTALEARFDGLPPPDWSAEESRAKAAADLAHARRLNAEADKLEREIAEQFLPPPDDGTSPVEAERWAVESRWDLRGLSLQLTDNRGRVYGLLLIPDGARQMAEQLLAGARHAETGSGSA